MASYLVALDESDFSKAAFYAALGMMNKKRDKLFLLTVVKDVSNYGLTTFANFLLDQPEKEKTHLTELLRKYGLIAHAEGATPTLLLGTSEHIGEMICQVVEKKKIDFLVIGRRGMGKLSRLIVGSNSKYCVEHADCNVLVVKGEWAPAEIHTSIDVVTQMEEEERQRRIVELDEKHPIEHIQAKKTEQST